MPTPEVTQVSQGYTVRPGLKTGALLSRLWIQEDTKAILFFFYELHHFRMFFI